MPSQHHTDSNKDDLNIRINDSNNLTIIHIENLKRQALFNKYIKDNVQALSEGAARFEAMKIGSNIKVFNLSKACEIVCLFGYKAVGLSRPVRSGKTNLLREFKRFITNEHGERNNMITESSQLIGLVPSIRDSNLKLNAKIHDSSSIFEILNRGVLKAKELFPKNKQEMHARFMIFEFTFANLSHPLYAKDYDTEKNEKHIYRKAVKHMNGVLDIYNESNTICHWFNSLEKEGLGIPGRTMQFFYRKLEDVKAYETLHEKIESLSQLLGDVDKYCSSNNIQIEGDRPWIPKIVILVDEFNCLEIKIKRKIMQIDQNMKTISDKSKEKQSMEDNIDEYSGLSYEELRIQKNILFQNLEQLITCNSMFLNSVKDNEMVQNIIFTGVDSVRHYFGSDGINSANDLTFNKDFRNCCGITKEEIHAHLRHYLKYFSSVFNINYKDKSENANMKREEIIYPQKFHGYLTQLQVEKVEKLIKTEAEMTEEDVTYLLALYYNNISYCFDKFKKVFNIWSVTKTLENLRFDNYWVGNSTDITDYMRPSDIILYFTTVLDPTIDLIEKNKITKEKMDKYREYDQRTLLKPTYSDVLIKLSFKGIMCITPHIVKNQLMCHYLYPSCLEAKQVLYSELYEILKDSSITCHKDFQKKANSFIQCENISLRLGRIMKGLKDEDHVLLKLKKFSERVITERFAIELTKDLDAHRGLINVVHQKVGNLRDKTSDKMTDVCVAVKNIIDSKKVDAVSIIEFKKTKYKSEGINNTALSANEAIACILARGYHRTIQFNDVQAMTIIGIHVYTEVVERMKTIKVEEPTNENINTTKQVKITSTGERIMEYAIKAIKIKDRKKLALLLSEFKPINGNDQQNIKKMQKYLENKERESETKYEECFEVLRTDIMQE